MRAEKRERRWFTKVLGALLLALHLGVILGSLGGPAMLLANTFFSDGVPSLNGKEEALGSIPGEGFSFLPQPSRLRR